MKTFEQFRRELADVVTVAINTGVWIGGTYDKGCHCPLGVKTAHYQRPGPSHAASAWGIDTDAACDFVDGFDGNVPDRESPFFKLGGLYRERFVGQRP